MKKQDATEFINAVNEAITREPLQQKMTSNEGEFIETIISTSNTFQLIESLISHAQRLLADGTEARVSQVLAEAKRVIADGHETIASTGLSWSE